MAAARRHVFVEKVLKRLFPQDPRGQEKRAPLPAAPAPPPEKERCRRTPPSAGGGTGPPPGRRLYTAALPPEGYVPAPAQPEPEPEPDPEPEPEAPSCADSDSEGSSSPQDVAGEEPPDEPKRRRTRKHKSKKRSPPEDRPRPPPAPRPAVSRNRKRKLKKKQQAQRKRAAGLLTKAAAVSFLYEPGDSSSEGAAGGGSDAEDPGDAGGQEDREDRGAGEAATQQDGGRGPDDQAQGVLDFLKSTQEMYFYDGVSRGSDPAFLAASEALLRGLAEGSVPAPDLRALGHMKALLLLQEPGALRRALQVFEEHSTLPPDQARVVCAFFTYWLTHVLPEDPEDPPGDPPEDPPEDPGSESGATLPENS